MREKRHPLSVRKLFPLLFSGMITVCPVRFKTMCRRIPSAKWMRSLRGWSKKSKVCRI